MELALLPFLDDFPILRVQQSNGHPQRQRARPLVKHLLNHFEDQLDQKVGQIYRKLPGLLHGLIDELEKPDNGDRSNRKRKLDDNALSIYEPKSKVQVTRDNNTFQISVDTSHYQPEEISVKIVDDKITISARHESRKDDVYEFHEMHRSFDLPEDIDAASVTSKLLKDGKLTVEAPLKAIQEAPKERNIPVIRSESSKTPQKSTPTKDKNTDQKS